MRRRTLNRMMLDFGHSLDSPHGPRVRSHIQGFGHDFVTVEADTALVVGRLPHILGDWDTNERLFGCCAAEANAHGVRFYLRHHLKSRRVT